MGTCDLCYGMGVVGYNGKAFIPEEQCPECDGTGAQEKYSRSSNHIQGDEIMKLKIEIDLDNYPPKRMQLSDAEETDVSRILRHLADGLLGGEPLPIRLRDINGNWVGWAEITR